MTLKYYRIDWYADCQRVKAIALEIILNKDLWKIGMYL